MAEPSLPSTIKAWQYSSTKGGIDKNLHLNTSAPLPTPKPDEHLVKVIATALNPVDYKVCENPILGRLLISKPAIPGLDIVGRIVKPAKGSHFEPGQLVFGVAGNSALAGASLREYAIAKAPHVAPLPDNIDPIEGTTIGVAAVTAYQSIVPHIKKGDKVFINGGSGGCGSWGIQIAKAAGCQVVTTCSTANIELCKSLGADEVVDYKKGYVVDQLVAQGHQFDHGIDNVGGDSKLIWRSHEFMAPGTTFIRVAGEPGVASILDMVMQKLLPTFLGGLKNKVTGFWPTPKNEDLVQLGQWVSEGKMKPLIDQKFPFEEAPKAFERLKTGRAKGKVIIELMPKARKP